MKIEENVSLARLTTFKVGGKARFFCEARSAQDIKDAVAYARSKEIPYFILGGGSNTLVSDAGFPGLAIKMAITGISFTKNGKTVSVKAGAGEIWDGLVSQAVERGLWGLENLSLIPGTVGAAPVQNIGAYGMEVKDVIESVIALDMETGKEEVFSNGDCKFAYRDGIFKRAESKRYAIVSVSFSLTEERKPNVSYKDLKEYFSARSISAPELKDIRDAVIDIRTGKFPDLSTTGTAGSFWKNPIISAQLYGSLRERYPSMPSYPAEAGKVKVPLAWILDNVLGLKGYEKGNVGLFRKQPIVVVAKDGATKNEIDELASYVSSEVKEKTGIDIEREVIAV